MAGLLSFHAHPDDEVIGTGGTLAHYAGLGEQVVVVTATDGAEGEIHNYDDPDSLKSELAAMRALEVRAALDVLGVKDHEFLGYRDSGMMDTEANQHPDSFWKADIFEASKRLVALIRRYQPEVMTIYDPYGGYGHPDHIQTHRVGIAAFFGCRDLGWHPLAEGEEYWAPSKLYWGVWTRSRIQAMAQIRPATPSDESEEEETWWRDRGIPDDEVSARIDVSDHVDRKLEAIRAHRTQIPADWFFFRCRRSLARPCSGRKHSCGCSLQSNTQCRKRTLFAGLR